MRPANVLTNPVWCIITIRQAMRNIACVNSENIYTIESNAENTPGGYGGKWKLFECKRADVEKISTP
ncbi:hypothetical protein JCM17042A_04170 [Ruminococcus champanellensis 18P13 = JCM 17042]